MPNPPKQAKLKPGVSLTLDKGWVQRQMDDAEHDEPVYMSFPKEHRAKLHSTNPIERLNGEIKPRTDVIGIFPNDEAIVPLVGARLLEQNDEWAVQRARYMILEPKIRAAKPSRRWAFVAELIHWINS